MRKFLITCWAIVAVGSLFFTIVDFDYSHYIAFVASLSNIFLLTKKDFEL